MGAVRWVRARAPDVALLPRRSLRSALVARLAGVPRRIGFARGAARWLFSDSVPFEAARHQVWRNLALLEPLGGRPDRSGLPGDPLEVFVSPDEREVVGGWLRERGLESAGSFHAVAPGSAWATKRWPEDRFGELIVRLAPRRPVVVMGGRGERALAESLQSLARRAGLGDRVHVSAGVFSPSAHVELLRRAAVLVANDSGALHLGQAAGIPVVALYGPTAPELGYGPRGEGHALLGVDGLDCRPCGRHGSRRCPRRHWRCMLELETDRVAAAVLEIERRAA
jgi:heptosyltransferase-2